MTEKTLEMTEKTGGMTNGEEQEEEYETLNVILSNAKDPTGKAVKQGDSSLRSE